MGFFANRRATLVENYLNTMIASRQIDADIPSLSFDTACQYAIDNGGKRYPDTWNEIVFDRVVAGQNYSIFFMKGRGGGTSVTLTARKSSYDLAKEEAEAFVARVNAPEPATLSTEFPSWSGDKELASTLMDGALTDAHSQGVPLTYLEAAATSEDMIKLIWTYAAGLEASGRNIVEQKAGMTGLLVQGWNRLDASRRAMTLVIEAQRT